VVRAGRLLQVVRGRLLQVVRARRLLQVVRAGSPPWRRNFL
jgi:hypothetical protein